MGLGTSVSHLDSRRSQGGSRVSRMFVGETETALDSAGNRFGGAHCVFPSQAVLHGLLWDTKAMWDGLTLPGMALGAAAEWRC